MHELHGFLLGKELYRSGTTVVVRAVRRADALPVVVKYAASVYPSPRDAASLRNEFDLLRQVHSPHVVRPLGMERLNNRIFLLLEDFDALSLEECLAAEALPLERCLQIAIAVADGLAAIHAQNIIHKDLCPANVLIGRHGEGVKIADLGIASRLSRENQKLRSPQSLEGTLPYISPEQTGRMNRALDYRSDLYSLGATLYRLFGGVPPFESSDAMELVHCHIAREPRPLREVNPRVPLPVCAIVAKLMAKGVDGRYQSAAGVRHDLALCLAEVAEKGHIHPFPLARRDVPARLELPQRIFGREAELAILMEGFERVARGGCELLLVGGYSGIGKSRLVREVHRPIARQKGYFVAGKYEQFDRGMPYSAVAQALGELVQTLLTEPAEQVALWKERIGGALGPNGRIVVELIPALEGLIGQQPPVPSLPPTEAQSRFTLVLQSFVRVFARADHPLVLFVDDLQWADNPSLQLLESLLCKTRIPYLFVIAAYRDNEVNPAHPLMLAVRAIRKSGTPVGQFTLSPLELKDVAALAAESLHTTPEATVPLTRVLHQKTGGNPFFLIQLLYSLHEDGLLYLGGEGSWSWDLERIKGVGISSNIVELMTARIARLPDFCKDALKGAACVGNRFDLKMLSTILQTPYELTAQNIWPALRDGLVVPESEEYRAVHELVPEGGGGGALAVRAGITEALRDEIESGQLAVRYRFLHDRVQQAAYLLIPEEERKSEHLKIARLLLARCGAELPEEGVFEIVSHFNVGLDLVTEEEDKLTLARLNLLAGRRARGAAANKTAVDHFAIAIAILGEEGWGRHYDLMLPLHLGLAECRYLVGDFRESDRCSTEAIGHARTTLDKAEGYATRVQLFLTGAEFAKAVQSATEGLALLGFTVPTEKEKAPACVRVLAAIEERLRGVEIATLAELPPMSDPEKKAAMDLLVHSWCAGYFAKDRRLAALSVYWIVATSLEFGNTAASAMGYVLHGMLLGVAGDYRRGLEFGLLGRRLNDEGFPHPLYRAKVSNMLANALNPYFNHLETNLDYYLSTYTLAPQVGDLIYGVWAVHLMILLRTMKGDPIGEVVAESDRYLGFVRETRDENVLAAYELHRQILLALQGGTLTPGSLDTPVFSEKARLRQYEQSSFHPGQLWHGVFKTGLQVQLREFRAALATSLATEGAIPYDIGLWSTTNHFFYQSLAIIGAWEELGERREIYARLLRRNVEKFRLWAETAPVNFLHRYQLILAELARLEGREWEAARSYDLSVEAAARGAFTHDEALALEWGARFYLSLGRTRVGQVYLTDAYCAYQRWGALAKTEALEREFAGLLLHREAAAALPAQVVAGGGGTLQAEDRRLDFATVVKAMQTISGEIVEEKLLVTLMSILTENAGAQRGILILDRDGRLVVEVETGSGDSPALKREVAHFPELVHAVVNLVYRTGKSCVVDDAKEDPRFLADAYVTRAQPKSVLCTPIVNQGRFYGLAYFENNLASNVFTTERLAVIEMLIAQAAISIENSALYQSLGELVEERTHELAYSLSVLNATLESTADGIYATHFATGVTYVNKKFAAMWGIPQEMLERVADAELISYVASQVKDPHRFISLTDKIFATPEGEFFDVVELQDGRIFERYCKPQRIDGEVVGKVVNVRDITERRRHERELREAQNELVATSRKAGMAEIASTVLHNVGNVLNSVNVSSNVISAKVRGSKAGGLARAVQIMREHSSDLGAFLTADPRGKLIPEYLAKLSETVAEEQREIVQELRRLTESVEHIKQIVATQQVFAGAASVIELVTIREVVQEALRMYADSLTRHRVTVVQEIAELPPLPLDRTRVLQILVNLISNAKEAVRSGGGARLITVRAGEAGDALRVSVSDDGEGIAPQNLTRIFNHGFTTRKDGHGFGLHSCALAAREMGGALTVESAGVGLGATFTLELPVQGGGHPVPQVRQEGG